MLSIKNLQASIGDKQILTGINLEVKAGEVHAIMGPNGSGKSTLLNLLGGVDRADSGRILFEGRDTGLLDGDGLSALRRTAFGTVFQFFHLLPTLTAAENVELPLQLNGMPAGERAARVRGLLERVGVAHRSEAMPGQMSGGEMQRVAIARAVAHRPRLLLADEPTGNLDSVNGTRCSQSRSAAKVGAES
jgi:ABC-type lipoprotein export system ATPase subunit